MTPLLSLAQLNPNQDSDIPIASDGHVGRYITVSVCQSWQDKRQSRDDKGGSHDRLKLEVGWCKW